jgi:hypothetical protein
VDAPTLLFLPIRIKPGKDHGRGAAAWIEESSYSSGNCEAWSRSASASGTPEPPVIFRGRTHALAPARQCADAQGCSDCSSRIPIVRLDRPLNQACLRKGSQAPVASRRSSASSGVAAFVRE